MNSYSLLKVMGDIDDKHIIEALKTHAKAKVGVTRKLLLVAILIFLMTATALAVFHSPLLSSLFSRTGEAPTKAAIEHVVQPDGTEQPMTAMEHHAQPDETSQPKAQISTCDFHIDEYLLDGDRLYLSYTLQNPTEEPLIYELRFSANGKTLQVDEASWPILGGTVDGISLSATKQGQLELELDETQDNTLYATLSIFVLRPTADFIRMDESSPIGSPVIVFDARRNRVLDYSNGWTYTSSGNDWFSDGNSTGSGGSMSSNHDDLFALKAQIEASEDIRLAHYQALESLGYVQIVERQQIPLRCENGAVQSRVEPALSLDAGIGELEIHSLTVGAVYTRLTATLRPYEKWKSYMNPADENHIVAAWVYLNGETEHVAEGSGNALVNWDFDFESADPDAYQIEIEWLSRDEPIRDICVEFVDDYERPVKSLGRAEWRVE